MSKEQQQDVENKQAVDNEDLLAMTQEDEEVLADAIQMEVDIETLRQELEIQKTAASDNLDKTLRVQAEMENLRKRTIRDIENAHKYAMEKFIGELLPVIDSLELGMSAFENAENSDDLREGMDLTLKKFISAIEKFGIKVVDPEGEKFNPEQHEAISLQEIEGKESGIVVNVMQKGYELNGRLIRPAIVVVAK